ncbi:MAG: hypothetical protein NC225_02980 [Clostridium sp.]|nr:hypothetical protein [Clostridium sp.]MCM1398429.1 hypothetical protein [Clostridium sp.]MCM1458906.1 hypothetical protein [Bacteroides sp.]
MKNTLAVAIPALAVFVVLVFMFLRYPILERISSQNIDHAINLNETLSTLYKNHTGNVTYQVTDLKYTGLDYYVDGKLKGAYYYYMTDGNLVFFLMRTDKPEASVSKRVKGTIVRDNVSADYIVNQLSMEAGLSDDLLKNYTCEYIISEMDYPYLFIFMVYLLFLTPIIICAIILGYTMCVWTNPSMHPQSRQLLAYGTPKDVIAELDNQLKNSLIYKSGNIYITMEYMVVSYLTKTDVVRLDAIRYLSKDIIEKKMGFGKKREVFRLTMENPDKMYYEVDFGSEEITDIVMEYIRDVNKYGV